MTRAQRTGELSEDIRALQENPDYTKEPLCKYIFSVDVYEDLIGIRSTADWAKGNADVPFMKEVKTNYAASNEADGVIIDGTCHQKRYPNELLPFRPFPEYKPGVRKMTRGLFSFLPFLIK